MTRAEAAAGFAHALHDLIVVSVGVPVSRDEEYQERLVRLAEGAAHRLAAALLVLTEPPAPIYIVETGTSGTVPPGARP